MIRIEYAGPDPELGGRQILGEPCGVRFRQAIESVENRPSGKDDWILYPGATLLFDAPGLRALVGAIRLHRGSASELGFRLRLTPEAVRDYYTLGPGGNGESGILLPAVARRTGSPPGDREIVDVTLPEVSLEVSYPRSLTDPTRAVTPLGLLLEYHGPFDLLFANQIAVFSALAREVPRSPRAWLKAFLSRRRGPFRRRLGLAYTRIHPTADVHPTAVIEGSVVGAGARIGAHAVVRYSHIAECAQLFDGAKVEFSVVGPGSWLMHDLVLYRCHVEEEVFLIHGPYQFSAFHSRSSAFATIMMDYRPDGRPIRAMTRSGLRAYGGRFLGAVLEEGSRTLGGSSVAPGIIVPPDTWLAGDPSAVHRAGREGLPRGRAVSPSAGAGNPGTVEERCESTFWRES